MNDFFRKGHPTRADTLAAESKDESEAALASDRDNFVRLIAELTSLQTEIERSWIDLRESLGDIHPSKRESARNLIHYLALRRHDIRDLQNELARNGVSSLGRSESHVMSNINKALRLLHRTIGRPYEPPVGFNDVLSLDSGAQHLARQTDELLGPAPKHRNVRIMVTLPSEAADDYRLVKDLIEAGMDCARINCAHDEPNAWQRMVNNIRRAREETGRHCRICIDLAGPKLRIGPLEPGPQVIKWRPDRDALGNVTEPAMIWLTSAEAPADPPTEATAQIKLPNEFLNQLQPGDKLRFTDARGRRRRLNIRSVDEGGRWAEARKTSYVVPETKFVLKRKKHHHHHERLWANPVDVPALEQFAHLRKGDTLILTRAAEAGRPTLIGPEAEVIEPARLTCTLPEIFDDVDVGEKIWFDDGKLGGEITAVSRDEITIAVTHAGPKGRRLRADKGINLPKSKLSLPALTSKDIEDLHFIARNADLVGYSFVRSADDVHRLQSQLRRIGNGRLGIVLKIETRAAFENLPEILFAAMESPVAGVMIARGDLAVESGFERLAEVQEEILWMCEAAHMPVIWATQVLEQLSKKGVYSRAEITDAAMSERAECVMLNKGPYIVEAVETLDNVLRRMQAHQEKKRSMMRPLKLATRFFENENNKKTTWLQQIIL